MGSVLPHAIAELLLAGDAPPTIIGAFASSISMRPGIDVFWKEVKAAGLHCEELQLDSKGEDDPRSGKLYAFSVTPATKPREGWGDDPLEEECTLEPLFAEDEQEEVVVEQEGVAPTRPRLLRSHDFCDGAESVDQKVSADEETPPPPARRELSVGPCVDQLGKEAKRELRMGW